MEILTGVASTTINKVVVDPVIELMKDVIQKEENRKILQADLKRMDRLVQDISTIFQGQQRVPPQTVKDGLEELQRSLTEAQSLLHRSEGRQRYLECLVCKPPVRLSKQIREWKVSFDKLYQHLREDFSTIVNAQQIAKSAPQKALLQDVPTSGFDGSGIKSGQGKVQGWLTEPQVRIVGIYGMAGIGKTSCLKMVYNNCINDYQHVIWVTVSADYRISDLQSRIAKAINLELPSNSDIDTQKRMLSASMESKKFLLVLDDLWSRLDLQELGVAFGRNKHSKVLFSTRRRDLIKEMRAEESIEIQPLSPDESWTLFRRIAFNDDTVSVAIQQFAREMADECRGLPLALTVIASAMFGKTSAEDWQISLNLMKTADPSFPDTHPRVDPELYQRLRLSYDALPTSNVKNCFLYCAMYREDAEIPVNELVEIWIAEGLVRSKQQSHLTDMAIGRSYINLLVDRCLFHNVPYEETQSGWDLLEWQRIRIHDVIRDMAIYIGEKEEKCIFKAGQHLQNFPEIHNDYYKRISLSYNTHIRNLPTQFIHPKLASLSLTSTEISEVPSGFLVSLTSLKVLDLSGNSRISSIPSSVGQLKQLEFLSLSSLQIQDLPEEISHISSLQFLDLSNCTELQSLPSGIGKLKNLKHLDLRSCITLRTIPHEISQLTSLSTLDAGGVTLSAVEADSGASIWSLKSLRNLRMLRTDVRVDVEEGNWASSGMEVGIMGNWLEMRHLSLFLEIGSDRDDVMEDVLPEDMQKMSKLQSFIIAQYPGSGLPEYSCKFEHLEYLQLVDCPHLRELSPLERLPDLKSLGLGWLRNLKWLGIGQSGRSDGYSRLEKLDLVNLERLESIAGPPNNDDVWNDTILPHLRVLDIQRCSSLKRLPKGMEKLRSLRSIVGTQVWWEGIQWVDHNMKSHLQSLFSETHDPFY